MNEIEAGYPLLLEYGSDKPQEFITKFIIDNPKSTLKKAVEMLGLKVLLDGVGVREFREITKKFGKARWYKLNKEMREFNYPLAINPFEVLHKALDEFTPLKLADFQEKKVSLE